MTTSPETWLTEIGPEDDDLLDVAPPRRASRVTAVLLVGIVATAGFAGGALVQKHHDAGLIAAPAAGGAAGFRRQFGGAEGGAAPGGAGSSAAAGGSAGGSAVGGDSTAPVVVGQVVSVSGTTLTVRNFAGRTVRVTVPEGTSVTSAVPLTSLRAGTSIAVTGTPGAGGTVTATGVTAR